MNANTALIAGAVGLAVSVAGLVTYVATKDPSKKRKANLAMSIGKAMGRIANVF